MPAEIFKSSPCYNNATYFEMVLREDLGSGVRKKRGGIEPVKSIKMCVSLCFKFPKV